MPINKIIVVTIVSPMVWIDLVGRIKDLVPLDEPSIIELNNPEPNAKKRTR
jgi:hypothetical protein